MSKLNNTIEYINEMADKDPAALIEHSIYRYNELLDDIVDRVVKTNGRTLVMLAGPSASGKTTTAQKISDKLNERGIKSYRVSLDDFYLNRVDIPGYKEGKPDFETPDALDIELFSSLMRSLLNGEKTKLPRFDFLTGMRSDRFDEIILGAEDTVVVEGIHALNPKILKNIPNNQILRLYVNVDSRIVNEKDKIIFNKRDIRFMRRLIRDDNFRGASAEKTMELWQNVRIGEEKYLLPYKQFADMKINTIHICEIGIYKERVINMLEKAELFDEDKAFADRLILNIKKFISVDVSLVPDNCLLKEFLG